MTDKCGIRAHRPSGGIAEPEGFNGPSEARRRSIGYEGPARQCEAFAGAGASSLVRNVNRDTVQP
jgi:hypothetical protein